MTDADLTVAYRHAVQHRVEVLHSDACGCFHCHAVFEPPAIKSWIDTGQTAVCPRCGMDAVIGSESGFALTEEFLDAMRRRWFKEAKIA